ncbi:MAG: hypothetical protein C0404_04845 [Verrucomicrobia bacterium]|nr:hypothetical protein [Verrucomicrobiota bacterium]
MSEKNERSGELISRYLDDTASVEEMAELNRLLAESPEVAREFARVSRQDGYLQAHFGEKKAAAGLGLSKEPAVSGRSRAFWLSPILKAVAAALVLGLGVWWVTRIAVPPWAPSGPDAARIAGPSPVAEPGAEVVAKIVKLGGDVGWRLDGGRSGSLRIGDPVLNGMKIETATGAMVKLAYVGEATTVEAGEVSGVSFPVSAGGGKRLLIDRGSLAVVVAPQAPGKPLVVVTPHAEVDVVGTAFDMLVSPKWSELDVIEGKLRCTRLSDGKKLELQHGQGVTAGEGREFVLRRCKYFPGGEYADGEVLFKDDLLAGIDNWDVVISTNGMSFRKATEAEISRIVRKVQPEDGWQVQKDAKGTVLLAGKGETVALRLKKPLPVVPMSVEFVRQAEMTSAINVFYGDAVEKETIREFPHGIFEPGGPHRPRREMIPLAVSGNMQTIEERQFIWNRPWYYLRIALAQRDGIYVMIGVTGDRRKAVFTDVLIREMKKTTGSK